MSDRQLLQLTAAVEGVTATGLLLLPSLVAGVLLGQPLGTPLDLLLARLAGAALLSLSLASWSVSGDRANSVVPSGVVVALLAYDVLAAALLGYGGAALRMSGIALWPAVGAHAALAAWCIAELLGKRRGTQGGNVQPAK